MSDQHLTRLDILAFIEGVMDEAENAEMKLHMDRCAECFAIFDELSTAMHALKDGAVLEHVDDVDDAEFEREFGRGLRAIEDESEHAEQDATAADVLFVQLAQQPVEKWEGIIAAHPEVCTSAFVQRLIDAAAAELDRKTDHALVFLRIAELVAFALDEAASLRSRGHIWKQRSNALRRLARYEEAIDAAIEAQNLYSELREPDSAFEVGQARYAMAVTLFKMTRYPAALRALYSARSTLEEYGETAPLAKVTMLEALIRIEQGNVATAREMLRELLPVEERLGQQLEVGRVRTNLAECNLRLNDLDDAMEDARAAIEIFRALDNAAELTRTEWTVAMIRLARGEREAIDRLYEVAAVFRGLGMPGEAGFVNLDVTAELLDREEWTEAETFARELVTLFTAARVTLASVNALDYLRRAVENREATASTVRYIRKYIAANDPNRPFEPPETKPN
jgi:tetratricopeptide (TPR) repeat protein